MTPTRTDITNYFSSMGDLPREDKKNLLKSKLKEDYPEITDDQIKTIMDDLESYGGY